MYLIFAIVAGVIGAAMSVAIRIELMYPGVQIFHESHTYNRVRDLSRPDHDLLHGDAGDDRRLRPTGSCP